MLVEVSLLKIFFLRVLRTSTISICDIVIFLSLSSWSRSLSPTQVYVLHDTYKTDTFESAHEKGAFMVFWFVELQMRMSSPLFGLQICVGFFLKLPQGLYNMSANSKGSDETALMRRLARAFAGRLCDYPFPMC